MRDRSRRHPDQLPALDRVPADPDQPAQFPLPHPQHQPAVPQRDRKPPTLEDLPRLPGPRPRLMPPGWPEPNSAKATSTTPSTPRCQYRQIKPSTPAWQAGSPASAGACTSCWAQTAPLERGTSGPTTPGGNLASAHRGTAPVLPAASMTNSSQAAPKNAQPCWSIRSRATAKSKSSTRHGATPSSAASSQQPSPESPKLVAMIRPRTLQAL